MKKYEKKLKEYYDNDYMDTDNTYIEDPDLIIDDNIYDGDENDFISDEDFDTKLDDWEAGYSEGYDAGYSDALEHSTEDIYESVEKEKIKEEKSEEEKAKDAIKGIIEQDWGGSNSDQYAATELISGLASNNSDIANKFMDDLNKLTDNMDLSKYGIKGN